MILYEEESKGLDGREDIYKMARALSRDTSPSLKRLPKYPPTNRLYWPALIDNSRTKYTVGRDRYFS